MAKQPNPKILTKKHMARLERERIQRRYLIIGTSVVLALVVGLILYGILDQLVLKNIQPVAKVGRETITTSEFIKEVRFDRLRKIQQLQSFASNPSMLQFFGSYIAQIGSPLLSPTTLGQTVLDSMVEDELVAREAEKRGIELTDQEIDQEMEEQFGFYLNGTPTPENTATPFTYTTSTLSPTQLSFFAPTDTPAPTVEVTAEATTEATTEATAEATAEATGAAAAEATSQAASLTTTPEVSPTIAVTPSITPSPTEYTKDLYDQNVDEYIQNASIIDLKKDQLREYIRKQLLKRKVLESIATEVEPVQEQFWARHILVATEEEAKLVIDRLNAGDKFEDVAAEVSIDTSNKDLGGDLQWFVLSQMVEPFSDAVTQMKIGEISAPVQTEIGYHVIQLLGREERPLTPDQLDSAKQAAYQKWLTDAKEAADVVTFDRWINIVPTDPPIPADVQTLLDQLSQQPQ